MICIAVNTAVLAIAYKLGENFFNICKHWRFPVI